MSKIQSVSDEEISLDAGDVGEIVEFQLQCWPVYDSDGTPYGSYQDSSLSFGASTTLTDEVSRRPNSRLENGEYWVDYLKGVVRGKRADDGDTITASYKAEASASGGSGSSTVTVNPVGASSIATAGFATKLQVSSNPCKLYRFEVYNKSASTIYLMRFNSVAEPADDTDPEFAPIAVPADSTAVMEYHPQNPENNSNGCWLIGSSDKDKLTEIVSSDLMINASYKDN